MNNKVIKYAALAFLAGTATVLASSCTNESKSSNADVKITFVSKAISSQYTNPGDREGNECMQTLRVFVAKESTILYNVYYDSFEMYSDGRLYKTITFGELPAEENNNTFDFYAIANSYEDLSNADIQSLKGTTLDSGFLESANSDNTTLIPQSAYKPITVTLSEQMNYETMPLKYAVAKVRLTIINTTSSIQNVNNIRLSGVNTSSSTLFPPESLPTISSGTVDLENLTVQAVKNGIAGSVTVHAYFFENTGGSYMLRADWGSGEKTLDIKNTYGISQIARSTELAITVTLSNNTSPEFNVSVLPWDERTIDVPPFE